MIPLTPRQSGLLRSVVESHIETSDPVGSQFIVRRYSLRCSPATVRNELGVLEEMGYLSHPHTSSGRIPTDDGYRYYLDHLPFDEELPETVSARVAEEISQGCRQERAIEAFLDRVSGLLSSVTREIGLSLSMAPEPDLSRKIDELKLSLQGLTHILEKPEFRDIHKLKALLQTLEEKILLKQWLLEKAHESKVSVSVGRENGSEALEDCAIVTARYSAGDLGTGVIAVLGPKRMPYRRVIPLVSRVAGLIGELFASGEGF
ncbi:MAG: Heat-inducible transcription repressor HrcA [Candidatus Omnitrophica bacterium ADurb.Bin314]|nr:MAG: Heat-inducible transcription repressor HrcA [Candidatus Omnitrophica bacterium ADurb.Bin314]